MPFPPSQPFTNRWSRRFDGPIRLPNDKPFVTLKDAAAYIMALPESKHQSREWQAAAEALSMAAEDRGPLMHAHVGMMLTLHGAKPIREYDSVEGTALGTAKAEEGRMTDMSDFADVTAGWKMSVTMQLRTPLKWLQRHREFYAGAVILPEKMDRVKLLLAPSRSG